MDFFKTIKEHWLISAAILAGAAFGMVWMLSGPSEYEIEKSRNENTKLEADIEKVHPQPTDIVKAESKPNYEEKSLKQGTSFNSKFGFMIYISNSDNDLKRAALYITLENQKDKYYKNVTIGKKVKVNHDNNNYSIEINDIRDNLVNLIIRKDA